MPSLAEIADALAQGLRSAELALRAEQAVHGLDVLDEVALHPHLADALRQAGFGVHREQRYPTARSRRRRSEGDRCDLVVTDEGRALRAPDAVPTLFDPPDAVPLDEAIWLEVKAIPQYLAEGANRRYAAEILRPPRGDVGKLARDAGIRRAGLVMVLFTADRAVAEHDLAAWSHRAIDRGLMIEAPTVRHVDLLDRIGNRVCTIAVFGVRGESGAV